MRSVRKSNVSTALKRPDLQPRFVLAHPSAANWLLPFLQPITHYPSRLGTLSTGTPCSAGMPVQSRGVPITLDFVAPPRNSWVC